MSCRTALSRIDDLIRVDCQAVIQHPDLRLDFRRSCRPRTPIQLLQGLKSVMSKAETTGASKEKCATRQTDPAQESVREAAASC